MEGQTVATPTGLVDGERRRKRSRGKGNKQQTSTPNNNEGAVNHDGPVGPSANGEEQMRTSQPRPKHHRLAKPQTFQLGPLDPVPPRGQSLQDAIGAGHRESAERKRFKVPRSQQPGLSNSGVAGLTFSGQGEDMGTPVSLRNDQPFDGQSVAAFLARNPAHLAGIQGATTDRRPGYLRAQAMPNAVRPQPQTAGHQRPPPHLAPHQRTQPHHVPHPHTHAHNALPLHAQHHGLASSARPNFTLNSRESWRRPPNGAQQPRHQVPVLGHPLGLARPNIPGSRINVAIIQGTRFEQPAVNVREVMQILERIPSPWPNVKSPFASAYHYTLTHPDPRSNIPPEMLDRDRQSALSIAILESWSASEPSKDNKEAVVRILNQVNSVLRERYGQRYNFVVEPFGSVSWGGETGDAADVDMTLKDFDRPFGYTEDLWPKNGRQRPDIGPIYNVYALSRTLTEAGYIEVEPIKWATTPIVKFRDPTSGFSLDLNTNDLGGEANSRMILAYCQLAPFTLRPLIHIVKTWAKSRNLNDSSGSQGSPTLSSYCWTLMCIAYMQSIGKLPNLQDDDRVKNSDRENCVIWVSWGKPQGHAANIGFADPSVDDLTAPRIADDIGEIVTGFFSFYYNMCRKDGGYEGQPTTIHKGQVPDTHRHVISVWKGGLTGRSNPIDAGSSGGLAREADDSEQAPAEDIRDDEIFANGGDDVDRKTVVPSRQQPRPKGKRDRKFLSADELPRGPEVDGFAQPEKWMASDLIVQDPFLHDKNCATALSRLSYERITTELQRAVDILKASQALTNLFEKADPIDMMSRRKKAQLLRREKRAQRSAATKAANQAKSSDSEYVPSDSGPVTPRVTRSSRRA